MEPEITAEMLRAIFVDVVQEATPTAQTTQREYRSHDSHIIKEQMKDCTLSETIFGTYAPKKSLAREEELSSLFKANDKARQRIHSLER